MKKQIIILTALVSVLFFYSCSKEKSIDTTNGNGGSGTNELTRLVYKSGADSTEVAFTYDGSQKVTSVATSIVEAGLSENYDVSVTRNAQGIIQQIVTRSDEFAQYGIDRVTSNVVYEGGRYKSKASVVSVFGQTFGDSTVYEYDPSGKINKERYFIKEGTTPYFEYSNVEYTYSGNNLASAKLYSIDATTGASEIVQNTTFEYDTKTSPLILGNEAFLINESSFFSANNVTKQIISDPADPSSSETVTMAYTYNGANKPATGNITTTPGGNTATATFYYK